MKIIKFCILLVLLIISGCSNPSSANLYDENDVIQLNANNKSTVVSQKMNLLKNQIKLPLLIFLLHKSKHLSLMMSTNNMKMYREKKFLFLKIPKNKSFISGKIKYENNTKEKMKIQTLFLQGNNVAKSSLLILVIGNQLLHITCPENPQLLLTLILNGM
ncbi:hypothetical protein F6Y05_33155 (plasmid) [Bacillus megaterium]|nr:hypothetical protein [Priestia megaterium]